MMTLVLANRASLRISARVSYPFNTGILISRKIMSGRSPFSKKNKVCKPSSAWISFIRGSISCNISVKVNLSSSSSSAYKITITEFKVGVCKTGI
jgi:hypothetical protein